MKTSRLPPHTMPRSMRGFSCRSNETILGLPAAIASLASRITAPSPAPPPTVPTIEPSSRTSIFAVS